MRLSRKVTLDGGLVTLHSFMGTRKYGLQETALEHITALSEGRIDGIVPCHDRRPFPRWAIKPLLSALLPRLTSETREIKETNTRLTETVRTTENTLNKKIGELEVLRVKSQLNVKGLQEQWSKADKRTVERLKRVIKSLQDDLRKSARTAESAVTALGGRLNSRNLSDEKNAVVSLNAHEEVMLAYLDKSDDQRPPAMIIVLRPNMPVGEDIAKISRMGSVTIPNSKNLYLNTHLDAVVI